MKALILLSILIVFCSCSKTELELDEVVLNGFVYDAETGKPIQDAKILIAEQHFLNGTTSEFMIKATTDIGGNFSVAVKKKALLITSFLHLPILIIKDV